MDIWQPEDNSDEFNGINHEQIISNWTEAITNLYKNYSELAVYIRKTSVQIGDNEEYPTYIGQCPLSQLAALATRIEMALEDLLKEASQVTEQLTIEQNFKRIATHTIRLNQLNLQAESRLQLLCLSSS